MKKKMIMLAVLVGAITSSGIFAKVGIKQNEITKAKNLAKTKRHTHLYELLGGPKPLPRVAFTQNEIKTVLWPVLVWAIEEGNEDLVASVMSAGNINLHTKKPYGRPATPYEIAKHEGQNKLANSMSGAAHMASGL